MIKRNIYIMYAISLLQGMVFYAPVATLYRQAQGLSVFDITLIESISFIVMVLLEIPWGYIGDRIGYKRVMIICSGIYFVSKLVFLRADGFWWFLTERILLGIVCAGLSGVDTAMLYVSAGKANSQKAFGIYSALSKAGLLFAAGAFALFIKDDFRLSAFVTSISYMLAALLSLFLKEVKVKKEEKTNVKEVFNCIKQIFINPRLLLLVLASVLFAETAQTLTVFLNQPKYVSVGLDSVMISLAYIAVSISGLCSAFSYVFTRKIGEKAFGIILFLLAGISSAILAFSDKGLICVLLMVILAASSSMFEPVQMHRQNAEVKSENRATILSMNSALMSTIAVFTNVIFGKTADFSINLAFLVGSVFCVLGAVMYALSFLKRKI